MTVAFLTLALGQLWNVFNVRAPESNLLSNDVVRNPYVWAALGLCVILIALAVGTPLLSVLLHLPSPGAAGYALAVSASFLPLLVGQFIIVFTPPAGLRLAEENTRCPTASGVSS